jgi:hypothetical protein
MSKIIVPRHKPKFADTLLENSSSDSTSGIGYPSSLTDTMGELIDIKGNRVLYFYNMNSPGATITNNGGPTVGVSPLQLIFWGGFWDLAVNPSTGDIITAVQKIIASPYLSEMDQYGFGSLPFGGARTVYDPGVPYPTYSGDDAKNMVSDLIDTGIFPEPDEDNGRNVYMIFAPGGTKYNESDDGGAHSPDVIRDFPYIDVDYAWVGWVNYGSLDWITTGFTHELVEIISDPEFGSNDAWRFNGQAHGNDEIGDICQMNGGNQIGPVEGFAVSAYYSDRLKKCVVPSNIINRLVILSQVESKFPPSLIMEDNTEASQPNLCFHGSYHWKLYGLTDVITISASALNYSNPEFSWQINGIAVTTGYYLFPIDFSADPLINLIVIPDSDAEVYVEIVKNTLTITSNPKPTIPLNIICTVQESDPPLPVTYPSKSNATINVFVDGQFRIMDNRYQYDLNKCSKMKNDLAKLKLMQAFTVRDLIDPSPRYIDKNKLNSIDPQLMDKAKLAYQLADSVKAIAPSLAKEIRQLTNSLIYASGNQKRIQ